MRGTAKRHVAEGRERVERQKRVLDGLPGSADPKVVELMRATLEVHEATLAQAIRHLEQEQRRIGGDYHPTTYDAPRSRKRSVPKSAGRVP